MAPRNMWLRGAPGLAPKPRRDYIDGTIGFSPGPSPLLAAIPGADRSLVRNPDSGRRPSRIAPEALSRHGRPPRVRAPVPGTTPQNPINFTYMIPFSERLRLVAPRAAFALALLAAGSATAQDGWSSACGAGSYSLTGAGINGLSSHALAIPGGADADSIVVEVIGKGVVVPTACTFSSPAEAAVTVAGSAITPVGSGSHLTTAFRRTMAPADTVTVATDDPAHTWSVVAYVFDADAGNAGSAGEYASTYLFLADWTTSYPLAPAATSRDVTVTVPITDLDPDARVAVVSASAGGVTQSVTVNDSDAGSRLRVVTLTLAGVPASATSVDVSVSSPSPGGDSFVFGVGVQSRCDGDFTTVCEDGRTMDVIGQGTFGMPTSTVTIPDPASVAYVVAEVIHKGTAPVTACTFSSDVDAPATVGGTVIPPTGDGTETVTVFRRMMGAASSVTVGTDDPAGTQSVVLYVFRNADGPASTGSYAHTYLLRDQWQHNFPLATATAPRDVRVTVPITELDGDGRYAVIFASAGGVTETVTLDLSTLGASLSMAELLLPDVPGWASNVYVKVSSPPAVGSDPGGDSFVFGVTVHAECGVATTCDAPAFTGVNFITPRSPVVYWEDVPGAIRYEVCGREAGTGPWRCHTRYVNYKRFYGMTVGQDYELKVRVQCADGSISPYGPIDTLTATAPRLAAVDADGIRTYPNPVVNELVVDRPSAEGEALITVRSLTGAVVALQRLAPGQPQARVDLSAVPAGLYVVRVEDGGVPQTVTVPVVH